MGQFAEFAALHVPGDPVVLFNIWDAGSAKAVARAGAKAIATGSHPVADSLGLEDGQNVPLDLVLENVARIEEAVDLPLTVDFEGGYSTDARQGGENVRLLQAAGAIGCNFEDQRVGGEGLHPLGQQVERIAAIRDAVGENFFINARTDLLLKNKEHDDALIDQVVERGKAYADAGASGFFVPRLSAPKQVERVAHEVPLPLNLIAFPGAPPKSEWADAGCARISHGPFPLNALMETFEQMARDAMA